LAHCETLTNDKLQNLFYLSEFCTYVIMLIVLLMCEGGECRVAGIVWATRWSVEGVGRRVITQVWEQSAHVTGKHSSPIT